MYKDKFTAVKKNEKKYIIRKDCPELLRRFVLDIDDRFTEVSIIKEHGWINAGRLVLEDGSCYFVKKYNNTTFSYRFRSFFREARPFGVLKKYFILETNNIKSTKPYGAMASRRFGFITSEYLVTEFQPDLKTGEVYKRIFQEPVLLENYIKDAVSLIEKMHKADLAHGDCKTSNFFIHAFSEISLCLGIWDLDGARHFRSGTWRYFIYSDIARFAVSICEEHYRAGMKIDIMQVTNKIFYLYQKLSGKKFRFGSMLFHVNRHLRKKGFLNTGL